MGSFLQRIFGRQAVAEAAASDLSVLEVDMHSHLLPGLDDGAETVEQSVELVRAMQALGYRKLVMTPHVMGDFYKNTPADIQGALQRLQQAVAAAGITGMELACAAEYYLDEWFVQKLEAGEELLTFGGEKRYVLFETSYINEPFNFQDTIFKMKSAGYQPVMAHPERYTYLYDKFSTLEKMRGNDIFLQVNLNSLAGYYSRGAKRVAEKLIDAGLVDLLGTDAHNLRHTDTVREKVLSADYLRKVLALPLLNSSL
ncbi:MAG TPA: CpsB/CapC family capsule biosynthesis tyrosine phosphatase [Hymenobacter sp.]|jgi:tyrosine-protein phosphatase YwqE